VYVPAASGLTNGSVVKSHSSGPWRKSDISTASQETYSLLPHA
jgi:hypothetical protein